MANGDRKKLLYRLLELDQPTRLNIDIGLKHTRSRLNIDIGLKQYPPPHKLTFVQKIERISILTAILTVGIPVPK